MSEGEEQDQSSKTEEPSQKKLEEAIEKGQVVNSKEVTTFIMFLLITIVITWVLPYTLTILTKELKVFVKYSGQLTSEKNIMPIMLTDIMKKTLLYISPVFIVTIISAFVSSYIQHGEFIFTFEQIKPKLSKISLIKGFSRIFSVKSTIEFLKGIFKIVFVGVFVYLVILADVKEMTQYQELSIAGILDQLKTMIFDILILVTIIMAVIAIIDFSYQKYEHYNQLKMTKQEVKDEYKQTEGNPEIKQKMKSLWQEQSKRRISQTVPEATVVITNPQHYAVALKYEFNELSAPKCTAKGLDLVAQKIKEIAKENKVAVVEMPDLARALYKDVKIDEEIPKEHFEAVAKIVSYVMSLEKQTKEKIK